MHVHGPLDNLPVSPRDVDRASKRAPDAGEANRRVDIGQPTDSNVNLHVSITGEFAELAARLRDVPEVREDLVQSVSQRLANGEYATRAAAEKTAGAMFDVS